MKNKKKSPFALIFGVILLTLGAISFVISFLVHVLKIGDWHIFFSSGVCLSTIGAAFYRNRKKEDSPSRRQLEQTELDASQKEKFDRIIAYVKEKGSVISYHIEEITGAAPIHITQSKFGGYPYWTADKEYPVDASGEKMFLLAQINFEEMAPQDDLLPKSGILQFFTANDDLCGADFEDPTNQAGFRIVYHPQIGTPLSIEELRALGIKANTDLDFQEAMVPSVYEDAITFTKTQDYISDDADAFEEYAKEAMSVLYGWSFDGRLYHEFNATEYAYLTEPFSSFGHKMLGFPAFTQYDPRFKGAEIPEGKKANTVEHYNTLLFQMDSLGHLMWGDSGVANFFINSEALKNLDFSDVLYNWDCY